MSWFVTYIGINREGPGEVFQRYESYGTKLEAQKRARNLKRRTRYGRKLFYPVEWGQENA